jgi:HEAT repeat protein
MLGSDAGYVLAAEGATSQDPDQRTLAAFALGAIGRTDSQDTLARLLDDPNPDVRLAAATAVLELQEGR